MTPGNKNYLRTPANFFNLDLTDPPTDFLLTF